MNILEMSVQVFFYFLIGLLVVFVIAIGGAGGGMVVSFKISLEILNANSLA